MDYRETIGLAFDAIRAHKMRSFLTLLGVIIGVWAIVGMQSLIEGFQRNITRDLSVLGSNVFQVQKYPPIQMGDQTREKYRNRKNITLEHAEAVRENVTAARAVGAEVWMWGATIKYRDRKTAPLVTLAGGDPAFQPNNGYYIDEGRFITDLDVEHARQVVVLGMDIVDELFPFEDPIGKIVRVNADRFEVIGILERQGKRFGQSQDNVVVIPISTFAKLYGMKNRSIHITVQARSAELYQAAMDQTIGVLRKERKVPPGAPNDFEIFSSESLVQTFNNITRIARVVAIVIVSFSLLVAGIGITNIMLVSVTERTREIGIRKSVGAKKRDVLLQFLFEAIVFCQVGGLVGIIMGIATGKFIDLITPLPAAIPIWTVVLGLGFCTLVGLVTGIYPAYKAARLDPIVALRYE